MKVIRIINGENSPSIYSYGYYCPSSETSYYCGGGSSDYIWSNDSTRLTNNAQKLLCPSSSSYWNTQSYSITDAGSTIFFKTNEMSTSVVWWYYFEYSTSAISSLRFTQPSSRSASFEVYLEKTNSNYTYMGTLWSTMNVSYSSSTDKYVWLLVTPLYPIDSIYMSVYANPVSSDSSSSNNKSVINIVITFSMAFVVILLAAIAWCVAYKLKSRCIQNKYFNNENRNLHARNSRTMMYNHASDLSIIIDEQSRENMNQSLPSSFQRKRGSSLFNSSLC